VAVSQQRSEGCAQPLSCFVSLGQRPEPFRGQATNEIWPATPRCVDDSRRLPRTLTSINSTRSSEAERYTTRIPIMIRADWRTYR